MWLVYFGVQSWALRTCRKPHQLGHSCHIQSPLSPWKQVNHVLSLHCQDLQSKATRDLEKVNGQLACPGARPTCTHHPQRHSQGLPGTRRCRWPTAVQLRSTSRSGPSWRLWVVTRAESHPTGGIQFQSVSGQQVQQVLPLPVHTPMTG